MESKSITSTRDITDAEIADLYALIAEQKAELEAGRQLPQVLAGKTVGMLFEKASLRTRVSFEVATWQLGGYAIFLGASEVQLGKREAVKDFARVICRYVDLIVARTFSQEHIEEMGRESSVPVINALSNALHPCQALGDFLTIKEHLGTWEDKTVVFVGDGNNVARSLANMAARFNTRFILASPEGYGFAPDFLADVRSLKEGASIEITGDPIAAVSEADVVYADVWASMGQEKEAEERRRIFQPYQINAELLSRARPGAIVMHCLPAKRGDEITDGVMDGGQAVVYDQAENRLHAQRGLMTMLLS